MLWFGFVSPWDIIGSSWIHTNHKAKEVAAKWLLWQFNNSTSQIGAFVFFFSGTKSGCPDFLFHIVNRHYRTILSRGTQFRLDIPHRLHFKLLKVVMKFHTHRIHTFTHKCPFNKKLFQIWTREIWSGRFK